MSNCFCCAKSAALAGFCRERKPEVVRVNMNDMFVRARRPIKDSFRVDWINRMIARVVHNQDGRGDFRNIVE